MQGIPISSIDFSWMRVIISLYFSLSGLAPPGTFRIEPTLYLPMTLSSISSLSSLVCQSVTMSMVSWVIWPIFSSRVISSRSLSILASISGSCGMAGPPANAAGHEMAAARAAVRMFFFIDVWFEQFYLL